MSEIYVQKQSLGRSGEPQKLSDSPYVIRESAMGRTEIVKVGGETYRRIVGPLGIVVSTRRINTAYDNQPVQVGSWLDAVGGTQTTVYAKAA